MENSNTENFLPFDSIKSNIENSKSLEQIPVDNTKILKYKYFFKIIFFFTLCSVIIFSFNKKQSLNDNNILINPVINETETNNTDNNNEDKNNDKNDNDDKGDNNKKSDDYNTDIYSDKNENIDNNETINNTNNDIDNNNINNKSNINITKEEKDKNDIIKDYDYDYIKNLKDIPQIHYWWIGPYIKKEIIDKFNNYMDLCKKGILIDNKIYNLTKSPKISVIMPLYNGGKYLKYSLRSIQNQKLKDIEIIIINDCSTDDSCEIIQKYMNEDPRIRLINNEQNRKILFSKSLGALYANGEYILELDQDDIFITDDAFGLLYKEAKKYYNNIDLIQFQDFCLTEF